MKLIVKTLSSISKAIAVVAIVTFSTTTVVGCQSQAAEEASEMAVAEPAGATTVKAVIDLDGSNFAKTIEKGVVLVDFWAPWCGPCRVQNPIIDELAQDIGNSAVISKVNVDHNRPIAQQFNIRSIPTLLLFKDGQVVRTFRGVTQKDVLMAAINELL